MEIRVVLDTGGAATAGVDRNALIANIQAEIDKLSIEAKTEKPVPAREAAPENAQGDPTTLHWLLHIASDPAMAKLYAKGLVFAINSIVSITQQNKANKNGREKNDKKGKEKNTIVNVEVLGKTILLPATAAAIQLWLKSLGGN